MPSPPRPIRLVVSDVDGTLIKHDHSLAPSTLAAVEKLRQAGVKLALVSSRPPHGLDVLLAPLGIDTPRAGFNGGEILDVGGQMIEQHTIPEAACRTAVAFLERAGIDVWVFTGGVWLLKNPAAQYVPREKRSISLDWGVVDDFAPHLSAVHKVMGSSVDFDLMGRLEGELAGMIGTDAVVLRSQSYYLDVTARQANKGTAATALARLLGVAPEEMACLGDMPNDVPMLEIAGIGIAMGNAPDAVKAKAHEVTAGNDDDGWGLAIDRFVLPRAARAG